MTTVRALWFESGAVKAIDQTKLPGSLEVLTISSVESMASAIRTLAIRGAPCLGVAGAYGMVLGQVNDKLSASAAAQILRATRPTAHDLFVGIDRVKAAWDAGGDTLAAAEAYRREVVEECHAIGLAGGPLIQAGYRVLTHCNAGALATVEWGTALAPIRVAFREGRDPFVWVDETRPLLQGSRLTAWELDQEGIRHAVIVDNAAGHFIHRGEVDLAIVGADRIATGGDFANKIGTYEKAVLAHENGVPFYVAAPWSTFDLGREHGGDIPVEERAEEEVSTLGGRLSPARSSARNPAFDVTPSRYVTGFITPAGVVRPRDLAHLLRKRTTGSGHTSPTSA